MSAVSHMNVWRSTETGHQWTDGFCPGLTRDFIDRVAATVESENPDIRRVAVLRVRAKAGAK